MPPVTLHVARHATSQASRFMSRVMLRVTPSRYMPKKATGMQPNKHRRKRGTNIFVDTFLSQHCHLSHYMSPATKHVTRHATCPMSRYMSRVMLRVTPSRYMPKKAAGMQPNEHRRNRGTNKLVDTFLSQLCHLSHNISPVTLHVTRHATSHLGHVMSRVMLRATLSRYMRKKAAGLQPNEHRRHHGTNIFVDTFLSQYCHLSLNMSPVVLHVTRHATSHLSRNMSHVMLRVTPSRYMP
jgi:primosomal replication protein N